MSSHSKEAVVHILKFGIDIDGTITQAPKHFKRLIDALMAVGNKVCIITGRDDHRLEETTEFLRCLGIRYDKLLMKPYEWAGSIPEWKVRAVEETQVQLMFDDEEDNCWAIQQQTTCLAAHALPIPEMEDEIADLHAHPESGHEMLLEEEMGQGYAY